MAGKISEGVDRGMRVDREMCEWGSAGTQTDVALSQEVESAGVQTDGVVTPSYADVAARGASDGDTVMGGVSGPVPVPPVRSIVRAQALVVHEASCAAGLRVVERCARHLNVGVCTVRGVRWLLGWQRRLGNRMSSVVVYLDRPVVVPGKCVRFGGALCPVERYVWGR